MADDHEIDRARAALHAPVTDPDPELLDAVHSGLLRVPADDPPGVPQPRSRRPE